jgi:NAD(P)H-hydrate epimerase
VTVVFLPEGESSSVAMRAGEAILERMERSAAMVIGPGLGTDASTTALLGTLFGSSKVRGGIGFGTSAIDQEDGASPGSIATAAKPVVVDADALNWLSEQEQWWDRVPPNLLVLTPHAGEMARLLKVEVEEVLANPERVAVESAGNWRQTVVLKGGRTIVAGSDGRVVAVDAPTALATAGSGDVLSGSIGALLAQGMSASDAAALAVFIGSRAADRLTRRFGTLGVVAGDLSAAIAEELWVLEGLGG